MLSSASMDHAPTIELQKAQPTDDFEKLKLENEALRKALDQNTRESNEYLQNVAHQLTAPLGAIK